MIFVLHSTRLSRLILDPQHRGAFRICDLDPAGSPDPPLRHRGKPATTVGASKAEPTITRQPARNVEQGWPMGARRRHRSLLFLRLIINIWGPSDGASLTEV